MIVTGQARAGQGRKKLTYTGQCRKGRLVKRPPKGAGDDPISFRPNVRPRYYASCTRPTPPCPYVPVAPNSQTRRQALPLAITARSTTKKSINPPTTRPSPSAGPSPTTSSAPIIDQTTRRPLQRRQTSLLQHLQIRLRPHQRFRAILLYTSLWISSNACLRFATVVIRQPLSALGIYSLIHADLCRAISAGSRRRKTVGKKIRISPG